MAAGSTGGRDSPAPSSVDVEPWLKRARGPGHEPLTHIISCAINIPAAWGAAAPSRRGATWNFASQSLTAVTVTTAVFSSRAYAHSASCRGRFRPEQPHLAGPSFRWRALAIEFTRRCPAIPRSLILVSAYAGWAGSLPAGVAEQRLRQARMLADLSPQEFVDALLPRMFAHGTPPETIDAFAASMWAFHPVGFCAMSRASAEDLRGALPHVEVPTLLSYGDHDVRAPLTVAQHIHAAITVSILVVLPEAGDLQRRGRPRPQRQGQRVSARTASLIVANELRDSLRVPYRRPGNASRQPPRATACWRERAAFRRSAHRDRAPKRRPGAPTGPHPAFSRSDVERRLIRNGG